jgi:hypothetical protein
MQPTEDRSRNNVLGRNTSHGRKPTCPERRLHVKTSVRPTVVVANILVQDSLAVGRVDDDDVVEAIAA